MKTYKITLSYDGQVTVTVKAKNKKEAGENALEGNYQQNSEEENGSNYEVIDTREL